MMTDDERREMARRLRQAWANVPDANPIRHHLRVLCAIYEAVGFSDVESDAIDLFDRLADLIEPQPITGDTSDGYHTFNELYDHRARLFSVVVRDHREIAWKSRIHHDGTMYDGMFIVGVETPQGQATYHYDIDPYWDIFDCKELVRAPEWDGHTPEQAISRIASLRPSCDRDALLALADEMGSKAQEYVERFDENSGTARALNDYARCIREACGEVEK